MEEVVVLGSKKGVDGLSLRLRRPMTHVGSTKALVLQVVETPPGLIIIDADLPRLSGAKLVAKLRREAPDTPVLLMSVDDSAAIELLQRFFTISASQGEEEERNKPSRGQGHVHASLHNSQSGRVDARRIAEFFGLPLSKLARVLKRTSQSVHKTPDAISLQDSLTVFVRIASALVALFDSAEKGRVWLNAPHPDLDNTRPMALIERRKGEIVAELLEDALLGHPG